MPIPDPTAPSRPVDLRRVTSAVTTLSPTASAAIHLLAADHLISPTTVVAAALVAYRGPARPTATPRIGVAVSGGSRVAAIDLPVGARHSASGLLVRVGACVDSLVEQEPTEPRDVVVAEGAPTDTTDVLDAVPVVVWCRCSGAGSLTLEVSAPTRPHTLGADLRRFAEFLTRFVGAGSIAVGRLQIVSDAERAVLDEWNATAELLTPSTLVDLVEMGITRDPDRAAVVTADGVTTHGDIDCTANRLARALLVSGVGPGSVVGVLCESVTSAMIAAVAVLRAGGTVLMISTRAATTETIVRIGEARATRVVTDSPAAAVVPSWVEVVVLAEEDLCHYPDEPLTHDEGARAGHLLSVAEITVSGSGPSDLAALAHPDAALVNRLQWTIDDWEGRSEAGERDVLVPADAHRLRDLCDVLWPLVIGATAHATTGNRIDSPTAGTGGVAEAGGAAFRAGGDDRPGWNVEAYVLDDHLRLVPPGASGDLYVGGAQLALGWPRDVAGTSHHFVANPFRPGERMVRVGMIAERDRGADENVDVLRRVVAAVGRSEPETLPTVPAAPPTDENRPARSGNPTP